MDLAFLERDDALLARPAGATALEEAARLASDEEGITADRLGNALRGMEDAIASAEEMISFLAATNPQWEEIFRDAVAKLSFEELRHTRPALIDYIDRTRLANERHFSETHAIERAYQELASRDAFAPDAWPVFQERFLCLQDAHRRLKAQLDAQLHLAEMHFLPALDARLRDLTPADPPLDEAVDSVIRRYSTVMEYLGR